MAKGGGREDADLVRDRSGMSKTVQNNPAYAAMVERVDDSLGRVFAALEQAGAAGNTIVILTSDHGGLSTRGLGNRRQLATSNLPHRQGKGSIFDGGLRVPLIVRGPGVPAGEVVPAPVHGVDLYPTMLDLAGLPPRPDQHVDGVSVAPALAGREVDRPGLFWMKWRARPQSTGDDPAVALIRNGWKLIEWLDDQPVGDAAPDGAPTVGAKVELFDLTVDPGERTNRAAAEPERTAALLEILRVVEAGAGAKTLRNRGAN